MNRRQGDFEGENLPRLDDQIDVICDRFEVELKQGHGPRIEEWLDHVPHPARSPLLRELIGLEVEFRRCQGRIVEFRDYFSRFPDDLEVLNELHAELGNDPSSESVTPLASYDEATETATIKRDEPLDRIQHFQLLSVVGQGGFGVVWRAFDTKLLRDVAIKLPRQEKFTKADIAALLGEAQAAAVLRHSGIVSVHEVSEGGQNMPAYIVGEYIDGPNLKNWLEKNPCSPQKAADLIAKVAQALDHAHRRGIVHRDLKPANVLMDVDGQPHLADFGLAIRKAENSLMSLDSPLAGTPAYMSPEQVCGDTTVDHRTDIYSLGVMFYELLVGQRPFHGPMLALFAQILSESPTPLRQINSSVPAELEQVCLKCLAKSPELRYQTAVEVAEDLRRHLDGEPLRGIPVPIRIRFLKWIRRRQRFVASLIATAVSCLILAAGVWWWNQPPSRRRLVEFTTNPPGCKITVVTLDPKTGDPDPTKIEHSYDRTPTRMRLLPGDYLVVAVLDRVRFHEVTRHVADANEGTSLGYRARYSKLHHDGCVRFLSSIEIPDQQPDGLLAVRSSERWVPPGEAGKSGAAVIVPSFLVEDVEKPPRLEGDTGPRSTDYLTALTYAESRGLRLPTSLELLYLQQHSSDLPELISIKGLEADPWEWTTTISGPAGPLGAMRILRCGGQLTPTRSDEKEILFPIKLSPEANSDHAFGVRGVRSVRPRVTPSDFLRPYDQMVSLPME